MRRYRADEKPGQLSDIPKTAQYVSPGETLWERSMSVTHRLAGAAYGTYLGDQIALVSVPLVAALAFDASAELIGFWSPASPLPTF